MECPNESSAEPQKNEYWKKFEPFWGILGVKFDIFGVFEVILLD